MACSVPSLLMEIRNNLLPALPRIRNERSEIAHRVFEFISGNGGNGEQKRRDEHRRALVVSKTDHCADRHRLRTEGNRGLEEIVSK